MRDPREARRTFQPVRRESIPTGTEADLWRPTNARHKAAALKAAERYERLNKPAGARNGPLGHVALDVLRALWGLVRFTDGRLDPSLDYLQKVTGRCRQAIVAALRRLRDHGFVRWRRRFVSVDGQRGVRGPQVQQTSNAYGLAIPAKAMALLTNTLPPDFVPDCEAGRRADAEAFAKECERQAFGDSPLGAAFAKLGAALSGNASLPDALNPPEVFSTRRVARGAGGRWTRPDGIEPA